MSKVYYEDIEVGAEISPLVKKPTTRQLVRWAGATGDFNEPHYDKDMALSWGLPASSSMAYSSTSFSSRCLQTGSVLMVTSSR
jgi:acyl dehydratase